MDSTPHCSHCREPLATGLRLEGLCPRCLLLLGMGADLAARRRIGPFEVMEEIGRGGMGVVFKAYQSRLHRVVALKLLSESLAGEKEFLSRFHREAQAAAAFNHPNTVTVYDVGADGDRHYIAMEFVNGPNLQEYLDEKGPLEWIEALRIVQQALRGLAAAHRVGVVHRDIKPHNIMLNGAGLVKVADFGLAKRRDDPTGIATQPGVAVGSPAYMAPEQARGAEVDPRTDLFSMGAVLYTLLVGHPPFRADTHARLVQKILSEPPPAIRSINSAIPIPVARLVERALKKDPAQRFASADEMENAVEAVLSGMGDTRLIAPSPQGAARRIPWRWISISLALGLIVAAVGVGLSGRGNPRVEPPAAAPKEQPLGETREADGGLRDPRLASQVRNALRLAPGEPLTANHLETLVNLQAPRFGIADLGGLERARRITSLNLSGNPIATLEPLRPLTALVQLELNDIPGLDGKELAHISRLPNLRSLQFEGRRNVDDALEIVSAIPTLEMLSILGGPSGTAKGVRRLDNLVSLNGLSLMHFANPIDDGLDAVGRLQALKYLNLTGSNVTDSGVAKLAGLERLSYFALGDTRITDAALDTIAQWPNLQILILMRENITDEGLRALAASSPSLEYVCILECRGVTDTGIQSLAGAKTLTALNLSGCSEVTARGIEALSAAPALRELHIGPGPAADAKALDALAALPRLTHLVVRPDAPLTPQRIDMLTKMKTLRFLGIPEESLASDDLARLRAALPECDVRTQLESNPVHRYSGPN